jgi:thiamine phosphate synthase YjbQ (UPF0047 family)
MSRNESMIITTGVRRGCDRMVHVQMYKCSWDFTCAIRNKKIKIGQWEGVVCWEWGVTLL